MDDFTVLIICLIFYGGILFALFKRVKSKSHRSRGVLKSYLYVLAVILASLILSIVFVWGTVSFFDLQRGQIATAFGVGAIAISVIRGWQWSFMKIALPIKGYVYKQLMPKMMLEMITEDEYISKYRVSKKKMNFAISCGKIKSSIENGVLAVEDKKC